MKDQDVEAKRAVTGAAGQGDAAYFKRKYSGAEWAEQLMFVFVQSERWLSDQVPGNSGS